MKTVMVDYGGFSTEQQIEENLYDAIYQQGREDAEKELAKLPNQYSEKLYKIACQKGREDALSEVWDKALKYDEVVSLEELNEILEQIKEEKQ